jgi:hypothetical protein
MVMLGQSGFRVEQGVRSFRRWLFANLGAASQLAAAEKAEFAVDFLMILL